jgi:hypothetical protein
MVVSAEKEAADVEPTSLRLSWLAALNEEILKLPYSEKAAYLLATEIPHLIDKESDPVRFLQVECLHAGRAARRLVAYWKHRKDVFGDRAFRHLADLTGEGALSTEDIAFLKTEAGVQLPRDAKKRMVLCLDMSRAGSLPADSSMQLTLEGFHQRCFFYWLSTMATEASVSQTDVAIIRIVREKQSFDLASAKKLATLIQEAMPIKVSAFHDCVLPPPGEARKPFLEHVLPMLELANGAEIGKVSKVHVEREETRDMLARLVAFDFQKKGLPVVLGGSWEYEGTFDSWITQEMTAVPGQKVQVMPRASLLSLSEAAEQARLEERKARKRKMDALYARNRRKKEKEEEDRLKQQCAELRQANKLLYTQNAALENILVDAKARISLIESGSLTRATLTAAVPALTPPGAASGASNSNDQSSMLMAASAQMNAPHAAYLQGGTSLEAQGASAGQGLDPTEMLQKQQNLAERIQGLSDTTVTSLLVMLLLREHQPQSGLQQQLQTTRDAIVPTTVADNILHQVLHGATDTAAPSNEHNQPNLPQTLAPASTQLQSQTGGTATNPLQQQQLSALASAAALVGGQNVGASSTSV